jgi:hypothetical protein
MRTRGYLLMALGLAAGDEATMIEILRGPRG